MVTHEVALVGSRRGTVCVPARGFRLGGGFPHPDPGMQQGGCECCSPKFIRPQGRESLRLLHTQPLPTQKSLLLLLKDILMHTWPGALGSGWILHG